MKFSVTIPAFKKKYLKDCIDSVLSQSFQDFEVIIVNDASPEDLDSIVSEYHDPRIKYYKNKIGFGGYNVVGNWNKCLEYASGDYVICMGDDDRLLPNCLQDYADSINQNLEVGVFHIRTQIINENNTIVGEQKSAVEKEMVYSLMWNIWNGRITYIGDYLFKADILKEIGGFQFLPFAWYSDRITPFMCARTHGIVNINFFGFQFRVSNNHISSLGQHSCEKMKAWNQVITWYHSFLKENQPFPQDRYFRDLIQANVFQFISDKETWVVAEDLFKNPGNLMSWIFGRDKYGLTLRMILKAVYLWCRLCISSKNKVQ